MLSHTQLGQAAMTAKRQAMPESPKFDGPSGTNASSEGNKYAANSNTPLPNNGSNS